MRIDFSGFVYLNFPDKFIRCPATYPLYTQDSTSNSSFQFNIIGPTGIVRIIHTSGIRKHAF